MSGRRIVAVVLPELLCEIAAEALVKEPKQGALVEVPLAVVLDTEQTAAKLDAVNRVARRFGVSTGQTIVEAQAFLSQLVVRTLDPEKVRVALARVAEVALGYGSVVSVESEQTLGDGRPAPDTVWIDITGAAHLKGGEQELAEELHDQVRALGHEVRLAIANGKHIAQAIARWGIPAPGERRVCVVPEERTVRTLAALPIVALPFEKERAGWLLRLGVHSVADLTKLPRKAAVSRLGAEADRVLDLCRGIDEAPLVAYRPERRLVEERSWEHPVTGCEPLVFALRGLTSRLSARLAGRGEAAQVIELEVFLDKSIAALRKTPAVVELRFELASPLWRERELLRVLCSRVERLSLKAPSVGVRCSIPSITHAVERQLDLSRALGGRFGGTRGQEDLPVLLAELNADIGKENVGVLAVHHDHRPEAKSVLVSALPELEPEVSRARARKTGGGRTGVGKVAGTRAKARRKRAPSAPIDSRFLPRKTNPASVPEALQQNLPRLAAPSANAFTGLGAMITRLLATPVPLKAPLKPGAVLSVGTQLYSIESMNFACRLEAVEWWTRPVSRDYFKVMLKGAYGVFEGLVYVELDSGKRYLQAIVD